ncbi:hypothetical protein G3I42_00885, partial [Streptomyces sp. SID11385]|nr:hypothetical protein [Streptomyces sp. SID11385]
MVLVASLLLPLVAVLLFAMDRVEDWMGSASPPGERGRAERGGAERPPHRRRTRHLRLVRGEAADATVAGGTGVRAPV